MTEVSSAVAEAPALSGSRLGAKKLAQFQSALRSANTPALDAQRGMDIHSIAYVKLSSPDGSFTAYLTEWDGRHRAYGFICDGDECRFAHVDLAKLAQVEGALGRGLDLDADFLPVALLNAA